eukprot:216057_1
MHPIIHVFHPTNQRSYRMGSQIKCGYRDLLARCMQEMMAEVANIQPHKAAIHTHRPMDTTGLGLELIKFDNMNFTQKQCHAIHSEPGQFKQPQRVLVIID